MAAGAEAEEITVFGAGAGDSAESSSGGSSCEGGASDYVLQTGPGTAYYNCFVTCQSRKPSQMCSARTP